MKAAFLLISAPLLFVLGLVSAFQSIQHGKTLFNAGYPASANSFDIAVTGSGGWVVAGFLLIVISVILYIVAVIAVLRTRPQSRGEKSSVVSSGR